MNWIRQNTFLAAFVAVTLVGAIALSVLVYVQYDKYSAASEQFASQCNKLKTLQALAPFPSEENLKKIKAQKQQLDEGVAQLQAQLVKMSLPSEPISPQQFQDKLRGSVLSLSEAARQNNVKLPEKFYLGFDVYQSQPPKPEACVDLANQLAGMETVYKILIDNKVIQIEASKRALLDQEEGKATSGAPASKPNQGGNRPAVTSIQKIPFEIVFKSDQSRVKNVLNAIAQSQTPFLVIRNLQVHNDHPKAPSKVDPNNPAGAAAAPAPAPGADPSKPAESKSIEYVLGTENVDVSAQIEIVSFKPSSSK
jgi:hypothetical protein